MALIPGSHIVVEKVPELATARGFLRAAVTVLGILGLALAALLFLDSRWRFLALVLQILIYFALRFMVGSFFRGRQERLPYTEAFFNRFLPATGLNAASMLYVLLAAATPTADGEADRLIPIALGLLAALYLIASALLLVWRAFQSTGIDTLLGVYVYFPDEGHQVDGPTYQVVRHPIYAALDRIVIAFGLWSGTAYALLLAALFVAVWHPIWYGIEERELLERFGESYDTYRKRTPAVIPQGLAGERSLWQSLFSRGG